MGAMQGVEAWSGRGGSLPIGNSAPERQDRFAFTADRLADALQHMRAALGHVICLDPNDILQCADYREQLDWLIDALHRCQAPVGPAAALARFEDVAHDLQRLDHERLDAAAHAYACARAYRALADLGAQLPAPADGWADIFAEADEYFVSLSLALQACGRPDPSRGAPQAH